MGSPSLDGEGNPSNHPRHRAKISIFWSQPWIKELVSHQRVTWGRSSSRELRPFLFCGRYTAKVLLIRRLGTAALIGAGSGLICVAVRLLLGWMQWLFAGHGGQLAEAASLLPMWHRGFTPVLGAAAATVVITLARKHLAGKKPVDYVQAVQQETGRIPFTPTLWRTASSAFSIATGAAIGREGSMIQFAAACVSKVVFAIGAQDPQLWVACGVAAAVASVYQAPIAGIFFAIEIVLGLSAWARNAIRNLPTIGVSAFVGAVISSLVLGSGPLFAVRTPVSFQWPDALAIGALAILSGLIAPAYFFIVESLRILKKLPCPMVWSGAIVGTLSCIRPEVWGNGDTGVLHALSASTSVPALAQLLVLRLVATAACVGSGVVGGVFTPTIFAGASLGWLYGTGLHGDAVSFAVLGVACLLASVTHAPAMAAFAAAELTGTLAWLPILLVGCFIAARTARALSPESLYAVATQHPGKLGREAAAVVAKS